MSDQWRVTVTFRHDVDVVRVRTQLQSAGEVRAAGGSIWVPDGDPALCVYAPDSSTTGPIAAAVRRGTAAAGVKPLSVRVDEWIPEEMRWSSDRRRATASGGGGDFDVVELILNVVAGVIEWPWP